MTFFRRERLFKSELGASPRWIDVIPREVTIKDFFHKWTFYNRTNGEEMSPFEEVSTVPFLEAATKDTHKFMQTAFKRSVISENEYAFKLYNAVYDCIEANWKPEKFHLCSLSSGFDTRLIAYIISQLRVKHGDAWIGDLVFYEIGEEGGEARKVLEYLGLDYPFHYLNEGVKSDEIYEDNLDFERAWERHGIVGWPVNYWYDPIERLQKAGAVPANNLQCLTGYACNETSRCSCFSYQMREDIEHIMGDYPMENNLAWYFCWIYYCAINSFPLLGNWIHPWYDFNVLETLYIYAPAQDTLMDIVRAGGSVSEIIVKHIDPGLYNVAHHMGTKDLKAGGFRITSGRLIKKAIMDYDKSWYGRTVHPEVIPNPFVTYNDWWGHWNLASLCQHLLMEGYTICYEDKNGKARFQKGL